MLPPLRRDLFVENVLWVGVSFLCLNSLGSELNFQASLAGELLADPRLEDRRGRSGRTRLEDARALAEDLGRFGLVWTNLERDVAARWGSED
jgi:hypothetical protein